jgi:hypothetical protein
MRKVAVGLPAAAGIALAVPAHAQEFWFRVGPVGVGFGTGPYAYDYGPYWGGSYGYAPDYAYGYSHTPGYTYAPAYDVDYGYGPPYEYSYPPEYAYGTIYAAPLRLLNLPVRAKIWIWPIIRADSDLASSCKPTSRISLGAHFR